MVCGTSQLLASPAASVLNKNFNRQRQAVNRQLIWSNQGFKPLCFVRTRQQIGGAIQRLAQTRPWLRSASGLPIALLSDLTRNIRQPNPSVKRTAQSKALGSIRGFAAPAAFYLTRYVS